MSCSSQGGANAAPEEDGEQQHDHQRAHQSQLLGSHGEDEVGVRLGKIEKLLLAFHQADAGDAAGAHRDQRLNDVKAAALRIGIGIEEGEDAVAAIGYVEDQEIQAAAATPAKAYPR